MSDEPLLTPVQFLKGVGPSRAELLAKLGIRTVEDLLFFLPREVHDLSDVRNVDALEPDVVQTVVGTVADRDGREGRAGKAMSFILLRCGGGYVRGVWFNQPWQLKRFEEGQLVAFSGKPKKMHGRWEMAHPKVQFLAQETSNALTMDLQVDCIYPLTDGLSQHDFRRMLQSAVEEYAQFVPERLPESVRESQGFPAIGDALRMVHQPQTRQEFESARDRLIFEELFEFQLGLAMRRQVWKRDPAPKMAISQKIDARIRRLFPFDFTTGQENAIRDVIEDLRSGNAMHRLLQADVGAGKTVVALYAILAAIANGYQAAIMAPTEVLANQHWKTINAALDHSQVERLLLTGQLTQKQRREALYRIATGDAQLVVGTQAVIQDDVRFRRLGVAVIDEQHKFGVMQRAKFSAMPTAEKLDPELFADLPKPSNESPHVLVMTATPIPRSLCLTQFGDLDLSVMTDLPPGRQRIITSRVEPGELRDRAWNFVREQIRGGRQAYVVCPRVEETEDDSDASAEALFAKLGETELQGFRVGLVHGRFDPAEKDRVMDDFRAGRIQALVSTTVIEVGVDVPNATLMVISHADRFGLSQLHQLRGRIGRGKFQGYCFLFTDTATEDGERRLEIMEETTDGFRIAETDFELRGPGDALGTRQHGQMPFKRANLLRDARLLRRARKEAFDIVPNGQFQTAEFTPLRQHVLTRFGELMNLPQTG